MVARGVPAALPVGAVVVLADRAGPGVAWTADPGWRAVLRVVEVGELSPDEAASLVDDDGRRAFLLELACGHPLALRLAIDSAAAGRDDEHVRLEVAQALLLQVAGDLPSTAHRQALEVCAYAPRTTESLLRGTFAGQDAVSLFRWLCDLPFVEVTAAGARMKPYLAQAVRAELRWRDPARDREAQALGATTVEPLPRAGFDTAVRDALRAWRRTDLLAGNPLARSRMIVDAGGGDRVAALRAVLQEGLDAVGDDPREAKGHRALLSTYLGGAPTQEAAAERLALPFSTYRRHLNRGLEVLCNLLWRTVYPQVPLHVEYDLTDLGHSVAEPLAAVRDWVELHLDDITLAPAPADLGCP